MRYSFLENKEISTQQRDRLILRLHIRLDEMIAGQYDDKSIRVQCSHPSRPDDFFSDC
jgi:hypothetical protein